MVKSALSWSWLMPVNSKRLIYFEGSRSVGLNTAACQNGYPSRSGRSMRACEPADKEDSPRRRPRREGYPTKKKSGCPTSHQEYGEIWNQETIKCLRNS